jgi:Cof subfamily protein (haloacid dehalogenase superfamily)
MIHPELVYAKRGYFMGKFDGILICTDLDGTLYKNDKTISEKNKAAIEYFKREGGSFTFVTGRLPYYATDAFEKVQPNVPFGCINGGGVYDGKSKQYIWKIGLPSEVRELVGYIEERFPSIGIQLCCFDKTYFAKENCTTARFRQVTGLPNNVCDYRDMHEPIAKILFCTDNEKELLSIKNELMSHKDGDKYDYIRSEHSLFEILPKGANKGLSLKKLAEYLKIDISRTIAIGDYDNDVAMLRAAGCGIAVANASQSALEAADRVTVSNEEDAIARVIQDLDANLK